MSQCSRVIMHHLHLLIFNEIFMQLRSYKQKFSKCFVQVKMFFFQFLNVISYYNPKQIIETNWQQNKLNNNSILYFESDFISSNSMPFYISNVKKTKISKMICKISSINFNVYFFFQIFAFWTTCTFRVNFPPCVK